MKESRLQALRAVLAEKDLDAVIITKYVNLHYFSGFRGDDTTLVIGQKEAMLITDSRYTEQAAKQAPLFEIVEQKDGLLAKPAECVQKIGAKKLALRAMISFMITMPN
jgi:Xaa-Pro aminopeptidase